MGNISANHGHRSGRPHNELNTIQFMNMVIQMTTGLGTNLFPTYGWLGFFPAITGRVAIEHLANPAFRNKLLGMANTSEKVHDMAGHKSDPGFFTSSHHLITVCIRKGYGLFTKDILAITSGSQNRLLM